MSMKCPVCKEKNLVLSLLETGLKGSLCNTCTGKWLSYENYNNWKSKNEPLPIKENGNTQLCSFEKSGLKLCPECNQALYKYRVGHGVEFTVDQCSNCNGMWFDGNEWEILKSRNIHDEIHMIFSESWQRNIRKDETQKAIQEMWRERLGEADFNKINEFVAWMANHKNRDNLLAYQISKMGLRG